MIITVFCLFTHKMALQHLKIGNYLLIFAAELREQLIFLPW